MLDELKNSKKLVGIKQSLKAIDKDIVLKLFIAKDADPALTGVVKDLYEKKGIDIEFIETSIELGKACGINIGAACAVIIKWFKVFTFVNFRYTY